MASNVKVSGRKETLSSLFSLNLIALIFNWSVFLLVEALRGGIISGELSSQQTAGTKQMLSCPPPPPVNPKLMAKTFRFITDSSC
jgi:hypothetical protein